ncbi:hypothetical protein HMPREF1419_01459 [Helicobacter pylori GAM263BFi]|nr:hypothetical protein HMPREF1419_01459 [Helicobacter pylori GAM263BFi]
MVKKIVSCSLNYDRSEIFTPQILYNFNINLYDLNNLKRNQIH